MYAIWPPPSDRSPSERLDSNLVTGKQQRRQRVAKRCICFCTLSLREGGTESISPCYIIVYIHSCSVGSIMLFIFISSSFLLECYMVYVVFTFYHTFHIVSHSICLSCLYEAMVARMQPCIIFYSQYWVLYFSSTNIHTSIEIYYWTMVFSHYHYSRHKFNLSYPSTISHLISPHG